MDSYLTVHGDEIPLRSLSEADREHIERCRAEWRDIGLDVFDERYLIEGESRDDAERTFRDVNPFRDSLSRVVVDLHVRLLVHEGGLEPAGLDLRDPFRAAGPARAEAS